MMPSQSLLSTATRHSLSHSCSKTIPIAQSQTRHVSFLVRHKNIKSQALGIIALPATCGRRHALFLGTKQRGLACWFHSFSRHWRQSGTWRRRRDADEDEEQNDEDEEFDQEDNEEATKDEDNSLKTRLRSSFKQLLEMRLNKEDISKFDSQEHSRQLSVGSLPTDLSEYKSQEELIAIRDVMDMHMKHASKNKALNMYFKYYRSTIGLEPSYKTYRYLFYKWRASPNTLRMLEPDFEALCNRHPNDLNGIRSVLNVILMCQRLFDYPVEFKKFFAACHGTDVESTAVWNGLKLLEWMPHDREVERVAQAKETRAYIDGNDGLVFKLGKGSEGLDWKKSVRKDRAAHRQQPGSIWEGGKPEWI